MAEVLGYNVPEELYYQIDHSWARIEDDGTVTLGMDEFFAREAGEIVYIDLPFEDDEVEAGETCAKLQSSKWIGKMLAPVSGTVLETNEELEATAELINEDPYDEAWVMKVQPSNLEEDLAKLMRHDQDKFMEYMVAEKKRAEEEAAQANE